jgi:U1 zinc finger
VGGGWYEAMSFRRKDDENTSKRGWVDRNNNYERHYCEVCNVWLASDRASILTHTNGKKHIDNAAAAQAKKSSTNDAREKQQLALQRSINQMESAAQASLQQDYGLFAGTLGAAHVAADHTSSMPPIISAHSCEPPLPPPATLSTTAVPQPNVKQEKKVWDDRRKSRDSEKKNSYNDDHDDGDEVHANRKRRKTKIGDKEGYYSTADNSIWLEGIIFGEILENDMPIQFWLGNTTATSRELQLTENQRHWRDGLVLTTRIRQTAEKYDDRMVADVAYLKHTDDTEEEIKKSVPLLHIRILLGNKSDDRIPSTLEEARVLALGGEDVVLLPKQQPSTVSEIDEATGFSGWSTVQIKRTTKRSELKEERDLLRKNRKAEAAKAEKETKDTEARRMEAAKVSNAEDSALGAYDIWGRTKDGYKGVMIHSGESSIVQNHSVTDFAKKLANDGVNTGFKVSTNFKMGVAKKRQNRRVTSADDD